LQLEPDGFVHLTYCTNIHAADGWVAVRAALDHFAPALKARLSPNAPFGVGLRLSARDARELVEGRHLDELRAFLIANGLYVAIINGFPYGPFHRSVVKAEVYAPDWREDARVQYTSDLIDILATLLPVGVDGGVSTVPLSYKSWMHGAPPGDWDTITTNVVRIAEKLVHVRRERGAVIHLDIEPEPDCVLENTRETVEFFERLQAEGAPALASALDVSLIQARRDLTDHIRVCFDCCHFSVAHEDPASALAALGRAGIRIGRIQLSSALRVAMPGDADQQARLVNRLRPFADSTYLHQVIRRSGDSFEHFPDLDEALAQARSGEWRIHFHVPLFTSEYDGLRSTQDDVRAVLAAVRAAPVTRHLEIETYTWDVLPAALKIDLVESIAREYDWVLESFAPTDTSSR
jgi:sugar phosphate isomerase/epimerase